MFTDALGGMFGKVGSHSLVALVTATIAWAVPNYVFKPLETSPRRNLSVSPVYIEPMELCRVDREELEKNFAQVEGAPVADLPYADVVKSLYQSMPESKDIPFRTLRSQIPRSVMGRLIHDRLVDCDVRDPMFGQHDFANYTFLKVQVITRIRNPSYGSKYLIDPRCTMKVENLDLQMDLVVSPSDIAVFDDKAPENPIAPIQEPPIWVSEDNSFYLKYDSRLSRAVTNAQFGKLIDMINRSESYKVRIECTVLDDAKGTIAIGGEQIYAFVGHRPFNEPVAAVASR
jgi:hypothetical protein